MWKGGYHLRLDCSTAALVQRVHNPVLLLLFCRGLR